VYDTESDRNRSTSQDADSTLRITSVSVRRQKEYTILRLEGWADRYTNQHFDKAIQNAIAEGNRRLILDCRDLMNESGDGIIPGAVSALRRLREVGGDLVLANVKEKYIKVIQDLGLRTLLRIAGSIEEAAKELE
jgi:anti-anti-sigma factor